MEEVVRIEIPALGHRSFERRVMSNDIAERVKKVVGEHFGVDNSKVTDSADFVEDLGGDSIDTVELVMALQDEFDCVIPENAATGMVTVKDVVEFIKQSV